MTKFQEFAGAPLALGSVHGVRQWSVDSLGRLIGLSYPKVWTPGENVAACSRTRQTAECKAGECEPHRKKPEKVEQAASEDPPLRIGAPSAATLSQYYRAITYTYPAGIFFGEPHCTEPNPCAGADPACNCGFWAYYSDGTWSGAAPVRGVIEGYGKTTVGTKGFRCSKARILALTLSRKKRHRAATNLVRRNYPDLDYFEDDAAMLAAFPLVQAGIPTPENDPEFWTRPDDKPMTPPQFLWAVGNEVDR